MSADEPVADAETAEPAESTDAAEPGIYDPVHSESEMREMIEETGYDAELGMALARDAQQVVRGELSEEAFFERHHEAVVEEFGADERVLEDLEQDPRDPDAGDGGASDGTIDGDAGNGDVGSDASGVSEFFDRLAGVDPDEDQSRREVMKKSGVVAGALGLGALGTAEQYGALPSQDEPAEEEDGDVQWGMVIDLDRCDGCLGCVRACRDENGWSRGANWMYVLAYEDDYRGGHSYEGGEDYLVRPCQHCSNAPCEKVCPVEARHTRTEDGLVLTDYDICIGCRYCQVACPYGVNYFEWGEPEVPLEDIPDDHTHDERGRWVDGRNPKGTMGKCTMCPTRQDDPERRGTVACGVACDDMGMRAIHFGDLNDPESRPNEYLRQRREQETGRKPGEDTTVDELMHTSTDQGDISTFRLLEEMGTEPNVIYVGNEPGPNAEQVSGPVSYEAIGSADARKDVTDRGAAANRETVRWDGGDER